MWRRLNEYLTFAENVCGALAAIGLGLIMLIVASDVALRYGFGRPWPWAYDIVSIYLTVSVFYLALPRTLREHGHVNVELVHSRLGLRAKHVLDLFSSILSVILFSLLVMITIPLTKSQYVHSEVISSYMDWPTWLSTIFVPIGAILTILRLTFNAVEHVEAILSGHEAASFRGGPTLVGSTISTGE